MTMNLAELRPLLQPMIAQRWRDDLLPQLIEYVKVPAKSPAFDASWSAHGYLQSVVQSAALWAKSQVGLGGAQVLQGMQLEIIALPGPKGELTPCIFFDIPATGGLGAQDTIMFYGHLDKQPEMVGWREELGPWKPVVQDGKLYGRGSADDGYAIYSALTSLAALDAQGVRRPRCVGLIETCEESGSPDLPAYLAALAPRLGNVKLVVGLDSGCANYDQLWVTTSLRGLIGGTLSVEILDEGVHSGMASGLVPSSFRIVRQLLNRIDDVTNGEVLPAAFRAEIPQERIEQAHQAGAILGDAVWQHFPWVGCDHTPAGHAHAPKHSMPTTTDPVEGILQRTWRAALSVTGAAGFPQPDEAGNVLRPRSCFKLSLRLPPSVDGPWASKELKRILEADPPYNARVQFKSDHGASGWNAPPTAPWLTQLLEASSRSVFNKPSAAIGEGGTIPFMNMLGKQFPEAQFLITGVLGPHSNAHGPNEFLHLAYAEKLTEVVAQVVAGLGAQTTHIDR
jgi:acetylornithine deacetylase/succinyl-diaminopimelate desuccinylase-like protein